MTYFCRGLALPLVLLTIASLRHYLYPCPYTDYFESCYYYCCYTPILTHCGRCDYDVANV